MTDDDRLEPLVGGYLDGQLTSDETQELIARLRTDHTAIDAFADMALADVLMEQHFHRADIDAAADSLLAYLQTPNHGNGQANSTPLSDERRIRNGAATHAIGRAERKTNLVYWCAAAVILLALGAVMVSRNQWARRQLPSSADSQIIAKSSESRDHHSVVATVEQAKQVNAAAAQLLGTGDRLLSGQTISIESGLLQVHVLAGADLIIKGPAKLEFVSPLRAVLHRGTLTARVADTAHGFRIDTPNAHVIDLGTEFGVSAAEDGDTNVVVFAGEVEMHVAPGDQGTEVAGETNDAIDRRLLRTGDGLRVASGGNVSRLVAINSEEYPTSFAAADLPIGNQPLIASVSDNLREGDTSKCYRIVPHGLAEDVPAYVDRTHQWNGVDASGIPQFLTGSDYIMPFNDDKLADRLEVTLSLAAPARLYVFVDDRVSPPDWVRRRFVNTGRKIGLDEGNYPNVEKSIGVGSGVSIDNTFSVWEMDVRHPDTVTLGSLGSLEERSSMYGIAATPLNESNSN